MHVGVTADSYVQTQGVLHKCLAMVIFIHA
jgi:hypothetical protein